MKPYRISSTRLIATLLFLALMAVLFFTARGAQLPAATDNAISDLPS